jgi:hypothetical protein
VYICKYLPLTTVTRLKLIRGPCGIYEIWVPLLSPIQVQSFHSLTPSKVPPLGPVPPSSSHKHHNNSHPHHTRREEEEEEEEEETQEPRRQEEQKQRERERERESKVKLRLCFVGLCAAAAAAAESICWWWQPWPSHHTVNCTYSHRCPFPGCSCCSCCSWGCD